MNDTSRNIVTQVAAKIAADLTPRSDDMDQMLGGFAVMFSSINDMLTEACFGTESVMRTIKETFPNSTEVQETTQYAKPSSDLKIVGKQHGDIPSLLISAAKKDGITKVYDNRDSLSQNPKRPWFKAVDDKEKAYWPPKA